MNIAAIRKRFPEYDDLSDTELASAMQELVDSIVGETEPSEVVAVGVLDSLAGIKDAINNLSNSETKTAPRVKSFKIKRDELGNIDFVIPQYEA